MSERRNSQSNHCIEKLPRYAADVSLKEMLDTYKPPVLENVCNYGTEKKMLLWHMQFQH